MKETLKAQLKEIGKRQSSMSVQEQTYWYDIAKNLDAAKDDPAALAALFVQINMGSGAK
jgi:hypothetical protein